MTRLRPWLSPLSQVRPRRNTGPAPSPCALAHRRAQIPRRFRAFRLVNPDAPKGGTLRMTVRESTFHSLNPFSIQGVAAIGAGMIYNSLTHWRAPGSRNRPSTVSVAEWVSYPADYGSATSGSARGTLPRRHAHHARGCHLQPRRLEEGPSAVRTLLQERRQGREDRRAGGTVTFDMKGNRELPTSSASSRSCPSTTGG